MKKKCVAALLLLMSLCPCIAQKTRRSLSIQTCLDSFALVPTGPATRYALELLVSIPDTSHPRSLFSLPKGRLGHVFLGLSKSNGNARVVEYVGFYARSPALAFGTGFPVASRLIDNGRHVYDAGMVLRLTPAAWDSVLERLRLDARRRYSILRFNCVHYALDAFNTPRARPLSPPLARFPGQLQGGYLTPNGVYLLLCTMRSGPEGKDVVVRHGRAEPGGDFLLARDTLPGPGDFRLPARGR